MLQRKEKKGTATADEHHTAGIKYGNLDSTGLFISMTFKLAINIFYSIHQGQENF